MNEVNFYQTIPDNFKLGHVEVNDSLIHSIIRQVLNDSNEDIFTISKIQNLVYEKLIRMENISDFHKFFVKKAPGGNFQSFEGRCELLFGNGGDISLMMINWRLKGL